MADEQLRLVASVQDQFSGPLSRLRTALGQVANTPTATSLRKDFDQARVAVDRTSTAIQGVAPILGGLGIASLGVTAALGGTLTAIRNFSSGTQSLSMLSRETGLAIDKLRAFGELGERFGVGSEKMQGSVESFASVMYDLRRRWGEVYGSLKSMNLGTLAESLVSAPDMNTALTRAMEGLGRIPDPEVRRRVSRMLFGTDDIGKIAAMLGGDFANTLADIEKRIGQTSPATVAAAAQFERALSELRQSIEGLKHGALGPLLVDLNALITRLSQPDALKGFKDELDGLTGGLKSLVGEIQAAKRLWDNLSSGNFSEALKDARRLDGASGPLARKIAPLPGDEEANIKDRLEQLKSAREWNNRFPGRPGASDQEERLRKEIEKLTEQLRQITERGATVEKQSFVPSGGFGGAMVHRAGLGPMFGGVPGAGRSFFNDGYAPPGNGGGEGEPQGRGSAPRNAPRAPRPYDGAIDRAMPPTQGGRRARGPTTAEGRENVRSWMDFLMRPKEEGGMGLSRDKARGLVAMLQGESGANLDPGSWNPNDRGKPSGGTAQWRDDRLRNLMEFAQRRGKPWKDRGVQQEFFRHELMEGSERRAWRAIERAPDGPSALWEGIDKYERPYDKGGEFRKRMERYRGLEAEGVANRDRRPDPTFWRSPREQPGEPTSQGREGARPGPGQGLGDDMVGRALRGGAGDSVGSQPVTGSVHVTLEGFPTEVKAKTTIAGLFRQVDVSRSRSMQIDER